MDSPHDSARVSEVFDRDDDDAPARGLKPFPAQMVRLALPGIALVMPPVVLDDHAMRPVDQVASGKEHAIVVEDLDIDFGFGQPTQPHKEPNIGFLDRVDPRSDIHDGASGANDTVEMTRHRVLAQNFGSRQAKAGEPIAGPDEVDDSKDRRAVDEGAVRSEGRNAS